MRNKDILRQKKMKRMRHQQTYPKRMAKTFWKMWKLKQNKKKEPDNIKKE